MPTKAILLTGGTGGIGACVTPKLRDLGYRPIICYKENARFASELAARCEGIAQQIDLLSKHSIEKACESLKDETIESLVLLSALPPDIKPLGKVEQKELRDHFELSVVGNHSLITRIVRDHFRRINRGSIVIVLSEAMGNASDLSMPNMGAYLIAKYGLLGLAKAAKADYPWLNIKTIYPGYTDTPMLKAFDGRFVAEQRSMGKIQPPESVANSIINLLTVQG